LFSIEWFIHSEKSFRYFVDEIHDTIFINKFPHSRVKVGDEVIKINEFYCQHLGNVGKYIENTAINYLQVISSVTGEVYNDEDTTVATEIISVSHMNKSSSRKTQKRRRLTIEHNGDSNEGMDITLPGNITANNETNTSAVVSNRNTPVRNTNDDTSRLQRSRKNELDLFWDYENPCKYCDYVHLRGASVSQKISVVYREKRYKSRFLN